MEFKVVSAVFGVANLLSAALVSPGARCAAKTLHGTAGAILGEIDWP
jgi:hypothetical protein